MSTPKHLNIVYRRTRPAAKRKRSHPFPTPAPTLQGPVRTVNTTDYATMPEAARKAMRADLGAHYRSRIERLPCDPTGLPELALAKCPAHPWIVEALRTCTVRRKEDDLYSHFIDPATRRTEWRFARTLMLDCPVRGGLAIDLLDGERIGGIGSLNAGMGRPTSAVELERRLMALAHERHQR